jgi:hypothetical protein
MSFGLTTEPAPPRGEESTLRPYRIKLLSIRRIFASVKGQDKTFVDFENNLTGTIQAQGTNIANSLPSAIGLWNDLLLHRSDTSLSPLGSLTTSNATVVAYETAGVWDKPGVPPDGPDSFLRPSSYTVAAPPWTGQTLVPIMGTAMPGFMALAGPEGETDEVYVIAGWQFKQEEILNTELIDWP